MSVDSALFPVIAFSWPFWFWAEGYMVEHSALGSGFVCMAMGVVSLLCFVIMVIHAA